jgi:hypothetical protein
MQFCENLKVRFIFELYHIYNHTEEVSLTRGLLFVSVL